MTVSCSLKALMCCAFEIFLDKLAIGGVEALVGAVLGERDIGRVRDRPMFS